MPHVLRSMALAAAVVLLAACSAQKPTTSGASEDVHDASIIAAINTAFIQAKLGLVIEIRVTTSRGRVVL